jgi:hypothetical protein
MRLVGKVISRGTKPWTKAAEGDKPARSGHVNSITIRDNDTEQLVDVASFSLPIHTTYDLDAPFEEVVTVTGMFRGVPQLRLASDRA